MDLISVLLANFQEESILKSAKYPNIAGNRLAV
jgi:hypothetical protein